VSETPKVFHGYEIVPTNRAAIPRLLIIFTRTVVTGFSHTYSVLGILPSQLYRIIYDERYNDYFIVTS